MFFQNLFLGRRIRLQMEGDSASLSLTYGEGPEFSNPLEREVGVRKKFGLLWSRTCGSGEEGVEVRRWRMKIQKNTVARGKMHGGWRVDGKIKNKTACCKRMQSLTSFFWTPSMASRFASRHHEAMRSLLTHRTLQVNCRHTRPDPKSTLHDSAHFRRLPITSVSCSSRLPCQLLPTSVWKTT